MFDFLGTIFLACILGWSGFVLSLGITLTPGEAEPDRVDTAAIIEELTANDAADLDMDDDAATIPFFSDALDAIEEAVPDIADAEPEPVELTDTGYWIDDDGDFRFAFVVSNPNPDLTAHDVEVNIIAKDSAGNIVKTTEETIYYIYGGGSMGFGGWFRAEGADTLEFTITKPVSEWLEGELTAAEMNSQLYAQGVNVTASSSSRTTVAGEVVNDSGENFETLWVNGLFYDGDKLLGGFNTDVDAYAGTTVPFSYSTLQDVPDYTKVVIYLDPWDL